jgi:hypothetical protein
MEPVNLSAVLEGAWAEHLRGSRSGGVRAKRTYVYASGSRDCTRHMALDLMHPEDEPVWTDDQLERFRRGNEREASVIARLMQIGPRCSPPFDVIEGQRRFEIQDRDGRVIIVGKIDGRLKFQGMQRHPIFEVKSGQTFANVETAEDLERSPWTRRGADQLLAYAYSENEEEAILVVDRPKMPRFLVLRLEDHLQRVERFLQNARRAVNSALDGESLPDFTTDLSLCKRCEHFGRSCAPPVDFGGGLVVLTDEESVRHAEAIAKNEEAATEYEKAEKFLKEKLRGVPQAVVGPLVYRGKPGGMTTYDIPKEVKEQYKKFDPAGKWIGSFERHGIAD